MSHRVTNFSKVENVGLVDSVFRGSLGIALVLSVLLIPTISSTALVTLTLIAIYAGLTAFLSWDPFYALVKGSRRPLPEKVQAPTPVTTGSRSVEQTVNDVHHKKAA
jgi:Inner membrane protein YgaP-like, transmembrane domain